ncbi:uncharacterized protein EV422DRAFT_594509 [Fimicolochytrium jonesii]|uniref:uncharacterized protein n=1 Tax=Fimicolochytrium jonesii TaxID=1396493 RepID=UPI0022FDB1AD|nr:uncharacterized protein EV422DRAFT_594509 [Fimicolochytrium jonesii]KAI8827272.1 hypothetical protein EV422DRAFT_594509 [Fimicolochytrium jonesii]
MWWRGLASSTPDSVLPSAIDLAGVRIPGGASSDMGRRRTCAHWRHRRCLHSRGRSGRRADANGPRSPSGTAGCDAGGQGSRQGRPRQRDENHSHCRSGERFSPIDLPKKCGNGHNELAGIIEASATLRAVLRMRWSSTNCRCAFRPARAARPPRRSQALLLSTERLLRPPRFFRGVSDMRNASKRKWEPYSALRRFRTKRPCSRKWPLRSCRQRQVSRPSIRPRRPRWTCPRSRRKSRRCGRI